MLVKDLQLLGKLAESSTDEFNRILESEDLKDTLRRISLVTLVSYLPLSTAGSTDSPLRIIDVIKILDIETKNALVNNPEDLRLLLIEFSEKLAETEYTFVLASFTYQARAIIYGAISPWKKPEQLAGLINSIHSTKLTIFFKHVFIENYFASLEKLVHCLTRLNAEEQYILLSYINYKRIFGYRYGFYKFKVVLLAFQAILPTNKKAREQLVSLLAPHDTYGYLIYDAVLQQLKLSTKSERPTLLSKLKIKDCLTVRIASQLTMVVAPDTTFFTTVTKLRYTELMHQFQTSDIENSFNKSFVALGEDSYNTLFLPFLQSKYNELTSSEESLEIKSLLEEFAQQIAGIICHRLAHSPEELLVLIDQGLLDPCSIKLNTDQIASVIELLPEGVRANFAIASLLDTTASPTTRLIAEEQARIVSASSLNVLLRKMPLIDALRLLKEISSLLCACPNSDLKILLAGLGTAIQCVILNAILMHITINDYEFFEIYNVLHPETKNWLIGEIRSETFKDFINSPATLRAILTYAPSKKKAQIFSSIDWNRVIGRIANLTELRDIVSFFEEKLAFEIINKFKPSQLKTLLWDYRKLEETIYFINYYKEHSFNPKLHRALSYALLKAYYQYEQDLISSSWQSGCYAFFNPGRREAKLIQCKQLMRHLRNNEIISLLDIARSAGHNSRWQYAGSSKLHLIFRCIIGLIEKQSSLETASHPMPLYVFSSTTITSSSP